MSMIFAFVYSCIFFLNGILILNKERFWNPLKELTNNNSFINKTVDLVDSLRIVLKIPVIVLNILCIIYEIILG